ncbi:hypothetical protein QP835_09155 [Pseudomonas oryzihabitans]|jgi:hypothetical protein|uniref:hypothetical protein n=1 Tax=Pseudomonas oryzihabitans TaxID=47885 RepID=UPI0025573118|nr:hypothetical protein [Pseudomonas oryzihabitans]MDK8264440.1 hypothetical protein [Pseudomonas oryzihabitans]
MEGSADIEKPPRRIIEFGAIITTLTLVTYALGYLKLAVLYAVLDCTWVLRFHGPQDFIANGAVGVAAAFVSAVIFSFTKWRENSLQNAQVILGLIGLVSLLIACGLSKLFSKSSVFFDPVMEVFPYVYMGPIFYDLFFSIYEKREAKNLSIYFMGVPVLLSVLIYIATDSKYKEVAKGLGSTYMVSRLSGADKSILVGSVNGKYLVLPCEPRQRFSIIDPGSEWVVSPLASASDCQPALPR